MSGWICRDLKCSYSGKDRSDGYPICKHPDAFKHTSDDFSGYTKVDIDPTCAPAQVSMDSCPCNLWRFSGEKRIPVTQSLLIEYETEIHT
jgi:hypothetical protein